MEWTLIVLMIMAAAVVMLALLGKLVKMPMASELRGFPGTPLDHDSIVLATHAELDRIDGNGSKYPYDQDLERFER